MSNLMDPGSGLVQEVQEMQECLVRGGAEAWSGVP
jgi:hypothetical protein